MAEDQSGAFGIIQLGMQERWGEDYDPSANPDTMDLAKHYTTGGSQFVVAELDGEIVGTGALMPAGPNTSRIVRMAVHPERRRQGIAQRIVADLIARARMRGDARVLVSTDVPWTSANALYLACGFGLTHQDEIDNHYAIDLV